MLFERPERRPEVVSAKTLGIALAIHLGFFLVFWIFAVFHGLFDKKEEIIPIDLMVVVNENLDGVENEPPPTKNPTPPEPPKPEPPKPKKQTVKEPEKPKELEQIVTNIVAKVDKKETKKPEKEKKVEKKELEKPKKTKAELRKERLEKMRKSAKVNNKPVKIEVKSAVASGNGRTDKKTLSDAEIMKLLNQGYKPGKSTQLAANEEQLGYSLIKQAFEAKWDKPPWTDTLRPMTIRVWFGAGGTIARYKLESSSGDARADQSIQTAASRVGRVPALPQGFIDKYKSSGVPVRFTVKPQ